MKRLIIIGACILLILSFSLTVYAQGKPFDDVTVTVVAHSGHHATAWYNEKDNIKELYGINLNIIEVSPDEIYSRVLLELNQKTGAYDIVQYNSAWIGDYAPYILPLDDYIAKDNDEIGFSDILPAFNKAQNIWGGEKLSVTLDGDTFLFYYREDLFKDEGEKSAFKAKFGYELPIPPQTWQQVVDIAQFFTRKKGEKLIGQVLTKDFYGYADQAKRGRVYYWYLFRFIPFNSPNPQYFDPDTMEPKINSSSSVAALENMKELLKYSPPSVLAWEWDELYTAAMREGTIAMWIHWTDEGRGFNQLGSLPVKNPPSPELGISPTPGIKFNDKLYQFTLVDSAWVASICKDSKNTDAAYAVLKYMFKPGMASLEHIMDSAIGWDPCRYSQFNSQEWRQRVPGIEKYLETELEALKHGYPMLKIPGAFEYNDVLDLSVSKYLAGEFANAKEALDFVASKWNELNKKFGIDKQKEFYKKIGL